MSFTPPRQRMYSPPVNQSESFKSADRSTPLRPLILRTPSRVGHQGTPPLTQQPPTLTPAQQQFLQGIKNPDECIAHTYLMKLSKSYPEAIKSYPARRGLWVQKKGKWCTRKPLDTDRLARDGLRVVAESEDFLDRKRTVFLQALQEEKMTAEAMLIFAKANLSADGEGIGHSHYGEFSSHMTLSARYTELIRIIMSTEAFKIRIGGLGGEIFPDGAHNASRIDFFTGFLGLPESAIAGLSEEQLETAERFFRILLGVEVKGEPLLGPELLATQYDLVKKDPRMIRYDEGVQSGELDEAFANSLIQIFEYQCRSKFNIALLYNGHDYISVQKVDENTVAISRPQETFLLDALALTWWAVAPDEDADLYDDSDAMEPTMHGSQADTSSSEDISESETEWAGSPTPVGSPVDTPKKRQGPKKKQSVKEGKLPAIPEPSPPSGALAPVILGSPVLSPITPTIASPASNLPYDAAVMLGDPLTSPILSSITSPIPSLPTLSPIPQSTVSPGVLTTPFIPIVPDASAAPQPSRSGPSAGPSSTAPQTMPTTEPSGNPKSGDSSSPKKGPMSRSRGLGVRYPTSSPFQQGEASGSEVPTLSSFAKKCKDVGRKVSDKASGTLKKLGKRPRHSSPSQG